ncbi:MAG: DUF5009 protein [Magnetococcales bacterium]|nr:DUF5009 protein [Magnetococcales bacterium]HIJ83774.1 DUF5009 domain-containing protein [Magnetococcales bacterium]
MTSPFPDDVVSHRLVALDVFRGLTFAGMMLVNNAGDWKHFYAPLSHAAWHGWTFADFVFPFFLWIVGLSMTLSFSRRRQRGDAVAAMGGHVLRRAAVLFGLGLFLSGFPFGLAFEHVFSLATIRIPGVLQRIALCYLFVGIVVLYTRVRTQWILAGLLLFVYWWLLTFVSVPGYGAGVLTPEGNLARYVDSMLLAGHTWSHAPAPGFDPEGLLSTLPAMATTLFGVLTGHFLNAGWSSRARLLGLMGAGIFFTGLGLFIDPWFPINKSLWTSSYVFFMAGMALVVFAVCHWLVDIQGWRRWFRPWVIYGTHTLSLYFLSGLTSKLIHTIKIVDANQPPVSLKVFYYRRLFLPFFDPWMASFLHAMAFVCVMYLIAWLMYRWRRGFSGILRVRGGVSRPATCATPTCWEKSTP